MLKREFLKMLGAIGLGAWLPKLKAREPRIDGRDFVLGVDPGNRGEFVGIALNDAEPGESVRVLTGVFRGDAR